MLEKKNEPIYVFIISRSSDYCKRSINSKLKIMKIKNVIYLLIIVFIATSCDEMNINGSGPIISESRTVPTFTSISSSLPANIIISQGNEQSLTIETHGNVLSVIESTVVNGELRLRINNSVRNLDRLDVYITAADFENLRLSGASRLETEGCLDVDQLEVHLSGATSADLCGISESLEIHLSGAGIFRGYDMMAQTVGASVSGASHVQVNASQLLDVSISGAATVRYKGNPQINSSISGAGSLINAN